MRLSFVDLGPGAAKHGPCAGGSGFAWAYWGGTNRNADACVGFVFCNGARLIRRAFMYTLHALKRPLQCRHIHLHHNHAGSRIVSTAVAAGQAQGRIDEAASLTARQLDSRRTKRHVTLHTLNHWMLLLKAETRMACLQTTRPPSEPSMLGVTCSASTTRRALAATR